MSPPPDWFELGRKLNVGQRKLEEIAVQYMTIGTEKCLSEVLTKWLEYSDDNSGEEVLVEALEAIGRADLAKKISDPSQEAVDSDYVTGIPSNTSIDRSLLVLKHCTDLQEKFHELISSLQKELSPIPVSKIRRFVAREIKGFSFHKRPSSVDQLFSSIHNHYCYLNSNLIESIILEFLSFSNIGTRLKYFNEELKGFCNMVMLKDISQCDTGTLYTYLGMDFVNLTLSSCWLNMSLEDLQKLLHVFFSEESKHLTHMKVDGESFCITWLTPKTIARNLILKSKMQEKFMRQTGILNLTVSQEIVFQQSSFKAEITQKVLNNGLLIASIDGNTDKASILITLGANPNCSGVTPLMLACKEGEMSIVELLLKSNADVNQMNENGNTALMAAATSGHEEIVKMLLAYSANPHARGSSRHTALSIAALRGHKEVVTLLLWIDANPNIQTENGWTPLMYAASHGDTGMVKALLRCGAETDTARSEGETAISDATTYGHTNVVRLIKAFKILNSSKNKVLEESPSPGTLHRRRSIPTCNSLNLEQMSLQSRSRKGSIGLSFHSKTMYPISQQPVVSVPRSIFRPTVKRGVSFHTSANKLIINKKR